MNHVFPTRRMSCVRKWDPTLQVALFFLMKEVRKGSSGVVAFIEVTRVESLEIGVDCVVGNRPHWSVHDDSATECDYSRI